MDTPFTESLVEVAVNSKVVADPVAKIHGECSSLES